MKRQALRRRFRRTRTHFRLANCFFVQLPRVNRLPAAFSRQVGVQLALGFVERVLGSHACEMSGFVCFFHFLYKDSGFWIDRFEGDFSTSPPAARRQCLVGERDVTAPAGFHGLVQFVQGSISSIGGFSHSTLLKKPCQDRPVGRLHHQFLGRFDFRKLSHSTRNIAGDQGKVQCDEPYGFGGKVLQAALGGGRPETRRLS
jgi:hypothetical protein